MRFSNVQVLGLLNKVSERNEVPKWAGGTVCGSGGGD